MEGHVLLSGQRRVDDATAARRMAPAGLTNREQADRILAVLLKATGPVLLCMPGTLGGPWQSSMYETARAAVRQYRGPISAVSIPYNNGILDIGRRLLGIGLNERDSVLAMVIRGLHSANPGRPILVAGESQGAWAIAHDLQDPELAAAVTRVVLFAKPGFQALPSISGHGAFGGAKASARAGAAMLPGTRGVVEFRHTDDIVPALFRHFGFNVLKGYVDGVRRALSHQSFQYVPHHYEAHGQEAASYLLTGRRPARLVHPSHEDL